MSDSTISPMEIAITCARFGWHVLPLHHENHQNAFTPGIKSFSTAATVDEDIITDWWTERPWAPVGIATTRASGVWVLDIDRKHGKNGFDTLDELEAMFDGLPSTFTVQTPSGGQHRYFLYPEHGEIKTAQGLFGIGLDSRGWKNGMVVAPWNTKRGIRYEIIDATSPIRAPEWLESVAIDKKKEYPSGHGYDSSGPVDADDLIEQACDVPMGMQDEHIRSVLFQLRQRGASRDRMIEVGWAVVRNFAQDDSRPWTIEQIAYKVDRTRDNVAPALSPAQESFVNRIKQLRAQGGK